MNKCPFCNHEVSSIQINPLDLRICKNCFATFFSAEKTISFRTVLLPLTRKMWLKALETKQAVPPANQTVCCIEHGEPLTDGNLPDYGSKGKVATCCKTLHLTREQTIEILKSSLESYSADLSSKKHHFFFIRILDKWITKLMKNEVPEEDALDLVQYNIHFKNILE